MTASTDVRAKVIGMRDDLANTLIEREVAIEAAFTALLCGEHALLLGPHGTGKSLLVRNLCQRIDGARYYERLLTRFSTPEELFGPLSLSALEHDRYERVTAGTLVEAQVAFIDEVFKANSAILNTLLGVMNERIYHEGGSAHPVPLLSLFGARNETPEDNGLNALYDRFLVRVIVPPLTADDSIRRLLAMQEQPVGEMISLAELTEAQQQVASIALSSEATEAMLTIKHELEAEGIAASDRRWRACSKLVRARAWLEGDAETTSEHCEVLTHALWTELGHIRAVERVVSRIANPLHLEAIELEDAARDLYDQRPAPDHAHLAHALEPLLKQLADIHARLEQRISKAPAKRTYRARQALGRVETWHRALSQLALKSLSKLHMAPGAA